MNFHFPIINTHSHHLPQWQRPVTLTEHLKQSYVGWRGLSWEPQRRTETFAQLCAHAPFVWYAKGLQAAWGIPEPLSEETWMLYETAALALHEDETFDRRLLTQECGYERVLLDAYDNPGYDNGDVLFAPVFRINCFLYGFNSVAMDHNRHNPYQIYSIEVNTLEEYIDTIGAIVEQKKKSGCVALKAALPYDRGLDIDLVTLEEARTVFGKRDVTHAEEKLFGDFVFGELCRIAGEVGLPVQIHTGLGMLYKSNPMELLGIINRFPATKFVLFHGGFPWTDEIPGLMFNHGNVYADLCWLPLLSPTAAVQFTRVVLEAGLSDRVTWGCDTWTAEESFGAVMAGKWVIGKVLDGMIEDGYLMKETAERVARGILHDNATKLYGL